MVHSLNGHSERFAKIMSIQENRATPYRVIVREEGSGGVAVSTAVQSLQRRISSACLYNNRKVPSVNWLPLDSAGIVRTPASSTSASPGRIKYTLTLHAAYLHGWVK